MSRLARIQGSGCGVSNQSLATTGVPLTGGVGQRVVQPSTTAQLEHLATLLPDEWLAASATGNAEQCATAVRGQLALGCDGVILHGATPLELAPVVAAYRALPPIRFQPVGNRQQSDASQPVISRDQPRPAASTTLVAPVARTVLDYDYVKISDHEFLLPLKAAM